MASRYTSKNSSGGYNITDYYSGSGIYGTSKNDRIISYYGNTYISTGNGDDYILDYYGNDTIINYYGNDYINAGNGNNYVLDYYGNDSVYAGNGNDTIINYYGDDYINAGSGSNYVVDYYGNDRIYAGNGNDTIINYYGNDYINAGNGSNRIYNYYANSTIYSGTGNDYIYSYSGKNTINSNKGDDTIYSYYSTDLINSGDGNDYIYSYKGFNKLYAQNGNDTIYSYYGNDYIDAGSGDDKIYSYYGKNTLYASKGNDYIYDISGDTEYIYNKGDGNDTIVDNSGNDTIKFGNGININNIVFDKNNSDLNLQIGSSQITFKDWYYGKTIENIILADGSKYSIITSASAATSVNADNINNNVIIGNNKDNIINGSNQNDIYIYFKGDGKDTITEKGGIDEIRFGDNILKNDLNFRYDNNDLVISLNNDNQNTDDILIIKDWLVSDDNKIESIKLADGFIINQSYINKYSYDYKTGTNNSEILYGENKSTIFDSKKGNDLMYGQRQNDIYKFGRGYGQDKIVDLGGDDTIMLVNSTTPDDLNFYRVGFNLELRVKNTDDVLTLDSWFNDTNMVVENLIVENTNFKQTILSYQDNFIGWVEGNSNDEYLSGHENMNNIINGKAGNDFLFGKNKSDTFVFDKGFGNDTVFDLEGSDTIKFGNGIKKENVSFYRVGNDMQVKIKDSEDSLIISNWFISDNQKIEKFSFDYDASFLTLQDVENSYKGLLIGSSAENNLQGWDSNDILEGKEGNDNLLGWHGDDVYLFKSNFGKDLIFDLSGNDIVKFSSDIDKNDLEYLRQDNDLLIKFKKSDDSIKIGNWFISDEQKIEQFFFEKDNSSVYIADIEPLIKGYVVGDNQGKFHMGFDYDDYIYGGAGDDSLAGLKGNDKYYFSTGDGKDFVADIEGNDEIIFGENINKNNVSFYYEGSDLKINYGNNDEIKISNQSFQPFTIEKISLHDGSFLTSSDINNIIQDLTAFAQDKGIQLSSINDVKSNSDLMNIISNSWHK